jgi:hypothetical protein
VNYVDYDTHPENLYAKIMSLIILIVSNEKGNPKAKASKRVRIFSCYIHFLGE